MNWKDNHNRVGEGITVGGCSVNCLFLADDSVQLASSEWGRQHALGRFSLAYDQTGMKMSTKTPRYYTSSKRSAYAKCKQQWRTQKIFIEGVLVESHVVVICIWCALFVTSLIDVISMFPSQRFGEVC